MPRTLAVLAVLALGGAPLAAAAQPTAAAPPGATVGTGRPADPRPLDAAPRRVPGYLAKDQIADGYQILPPPPRPGSHEPAELLDQQGYEASRRLQGGPRWALATSDADESPAGSVAVFDCVFGLDLSPRTAPALVHLLTRVRSDAGTQSTQAKVRFQHWRPFVSYGGPICEADADRVAHSWSYPSGHTTMIWAFGLILTELAPDLATPILERTRAYGESRVVCGVHTVSDVTQGEVTGAILTARLHADPVFKADLEAARVELAALRRAGGAVPAGRQCAVEREAMARTPWLPAKDPGRAPADPPKTLPPHVALSR